MASFRERYLLPSVLIIEDNIDHAELISHSLRKFELGFTVVHAGLEGWQQLQTNRVDLLIIDYGLPDLDGLTLLKKLRHNDSDFPYTIPEENREIPVIMVTAHRDRWLTEQACRYGANYFLVKTAENKYLRKLEEIVVRELGVTRRKPSYSSAFDLPWMNSYLKSCLN